MIVMHLNDTEFCKLQGFLPSIKYYKSFLNYLLFVSTCLKTASFIAKILVKTNLKLYPRSNLSRAGMGSITLKCNSLHYNYFGKMCHYITLQLLYFVNVINYITITLSQ